MEFLASLNPAYLPFIFILCLMAIIMYRAHVSSNEKFSLYDTLVDSTSGKASLEKIGMWMAILSTSWWFFDKAAQHTAGWEDMVAYGGLLGLAKLGSTLLKAKYSNGTDKEEKDETVQ